MKTILLEVEEKSYQTILDFIKLLPKDQCRVVDDDEKERQQKIGETIKCIFERRKSAYQRLAKG